MRRISKEEALADMAARGFSRTATGCVMCDLVGAREDDAARSLRVRESPRAVVVLDRYASASGNLLVILRDHVEADGDPRTAV